MFNLQPEHCAPNNQDCAAIAQSDSQIWLYRIEGEHISACHQQINPFLSRIVNPVEVFSGAGMLDDPGPLPLARSTSDHDQGKRTFLIVTDSQQIKTGMWAYLTYQKELYGGMVVAIDRDTNETLSIEIDAGKVVPFPPPVAAGDWVRGINR